MFPFLRLRKSIPRTTFTLMLANKNVFWKNQAFLSLFSTWKLVSIMLNVSKIELSIFWVLTSVWRILKPRFNAYTHFFEPNQIMNTWYLISNTSSFFFLGSPASVTLTPVAGLESFYCCCCWSFWCQSFFFSCRAFAEESKLLKRGVVGSKAQTLAAVV